MIDKTNNIPIFRQIYTNLIMEMQISRFKKGDLLPGTRSLALDLNVSRNSVERAYMQLEIEGYILSKPNLGFVVLDTFSEIKLEAIPNMRKPQTESSDSIIDFKYGGNGFSTFPKAKWKQYTLEVLSSETDPFLDNKGNINLRIAISEYLYRHRGVRASYEQIVVTNGYVYSLEIMSNILKARNPKSTITMEDPGFPVTRNTLIKNGMFDEPFVYSNGNLELPEKVNSCLKAVIVTPSHHFPTGSVMGVSMRQTLLTWARAHSMYIIEDDYDSEFRYKGDPIPSLQSMDESGNVIYFGTFSKPLSSTLRISYVILPVSLLPSYEARYEGYTSSVSTLQQSILEKFLVNQDYEKHIRKMRKSFKKKHDLIKTICEKQFGGRVSIHGEHGGLFILLEVHKNASSDTLVEEALQNGVKVYPTTDFYLDGREKSTVFMGFADVSSRDIEKGIELLNQAWFGDLNDVVD